MSAGMMSLQLTAVGMGTVFVILAALGMIMQIFKYLFAGKPGPPVNPARSTPAGAEMATPRQDQQEELVAVIAAASHFARLKWQRPVLVKAVTPVWDEKHQSSWLEAGRQEIINSRLELRRAL